MSPSILIRQQRERRDAPGTMTRLAVLLENADNLIVESDVFSRAQLSRKQDAQHEREGCSENFHGESTVPLRLGW